MKAFPSWSAPLLIAIAAVLSFYGIGAEYTDGYALELRTVHFPDHRYLTFLAQYTVFGGIAAMFGALALLRAVDADAVGRRWRSGSDAQWLGVAMVVALLLPVVIHLLVLKGMHITSDESAYRYASEHLLHGRLWGDSHPEKSFFDRMYMINDGRYFSQYFLGWPLLMVPGTLFGLPWLVNPILNACTLPALFWVLRAQFGARYARLGLVLFVASPMLLVGAATSLSHTSCLFTVVWATFLAMRAREASSSVWLSGGFAVLVCLTVSIRPFTGLALCLPLVAWWLSGVWGTPDRTRRFLAFLGPAFLGAAAFLAVNVAQHGTITGNGYAHYWRYLETNGFEFSGKRRNRVGVPNLSFSLGWRPIAQLGLGLFRLHFAWLGWPLLFVFAPLVRVTKRTAPFLLMFVSLCAALSVSFDAGIDTYGPVHFTELIWPALLLLVAAVAQWEALFEEAPRRLRALPAAFVAASIIVSLVCYVPIRVDKLSSTAETIRQPFAALQKAGVKNALVFFDLPWAGACPDQHFHRAPPVNDYALENEVLWANNRGKKKNYAFASRYFPERTPFLLRRGKGCVYTVTRINE